MKPAKLDTSKLIDDGQLLETLFAPEVRPKKRTLADWRKRRIIPYYKISNQVMYDLEDVRESLKRKNYIKAI